MLIEQARHNMLKQQMRANGVVDDTLLTLLQNTPREEFVPEPYRQLAFAETMIPLAHQQTMLLPSEEADILNALQVQANESVLDVGTGTGYFTALLAKQAAHVDSIDIFTDFTQAAAAKLAWLGITNVTFFSGDVNQDFGQAAQYDTVVITAALPFLPHSLQRLVKPSGKIFAIIASDLMMHGILFTRIDPNHWNQRILFNTQVPHLLNFNHPQPFIF